MKRFTGFLVYNNRLVSIFSLGFASGITIWPIIFLRAKNDIVVNINHERIHIRQQQETFLIGFYLIYLLEFLYYRLSNHRLNAYKKISFEIEAYNHEADLEYLDNRKWYAWVKRSNSEDKN
ncbi:MAG TPA: hypothetical protein VK590_00620 [Saprospiraceae bacterium]|nr:hypothetical protein [Saprospiraceae bacterium]